MLPTEGGERERENQNPSPHLFFHLANTTFDPTPNKLAAGYITFGLLCVDPIDTHVSKWEPFATMVATRLRRLPLHFSAAKRREKVNKSIAQPVTPSDGG